MFLTNLQSTSTIFEGILALAFRLGIKILGMTFKAFVFSFKMATNMYKLKIFPRK